MATTIEIPSVLANSSAVPTNNDIPLLPSTLPARLISAADWAGSDFQDDRSSFVYVLTATDLAEVQVALENFKSLGLDGGCISCDNFPLVGLQAHLSTLSKDIHQGRGFGVIRGIDPSQYSVEDLTLVYLGLQAHIADQRGRQDCRGNMLVHIVADKSTLERQSHHRHSTSPISFHTEESGDVVSWLTRSTAARGGKCIIASGVKVYNLLAAHRPDVVRVLARSDWPFALPRYQCRPILFYEDGQLMLNFGRTALIGSATNPRKAHLPTLSSKQLEALDVVEAFARATEFEIATQAGDIHFINNRIILHRRDGFVDGDSCTEKRHLVRMRLRSSEYGLAVPESLQREWYDAFERSADTMWHLEPMPDAFFPLRKFPN